MVTFWIALWVIGWLFVSIGFWSFFEHLRNKKPITKLVLLEWMAGLFLLIVLCTKTTITITQGV